MAPVTRKTGSSQKGNHNKRILSENRATQSSRASRGSPKRKLNGETKAADQDDEEDSSSEDDSDDDEDEYKGDSPSLVKRNGTFSDFEDDEVDVAEEIANLDPSNAEKVKDARQYVIQLEKECIQLKRREGKKITSNVWTFGYFMQPHLKDKAKEYIAKCKCTVITIIILMLL